ncbi:unnamed protein product, partial [Heterotrigona itama]
NRNNVSKRSETTPCVLEVQHTMNNRVPCKSKTHGRITRRINAA